MADFHRARHTSAYSGGTVPVSDRIVYFPPIPFLREGRHSNAIFCFSSRLYTLSEKMSIRFAAQKQKSARRRKQCAQADEAQRQPRSGNHG